MVALLSTIPGATNRFINPSFETATTGFTSITGVTSGPTLVTGGAYAGDDYIRYVLSSSGTGSIGFVQATHKIPVVANDSIRGGLAIKGTAGQVLGINWSIYNSGNGLLQSQTALAYTLTADWVYLILPEFSFADATANYARLFLTHSNTGVATTVDLDAIDVRVNQPFDNYIDGDQGAIYTWTGTAHASTSVRAAAVPQRATGQGGVIRVSTEVFLSDALGKEYDDLSEYVLDGDVAYDIDREIKGTCTLSVTDTTIFQSFIWVKLYQSVFREVEDSVERESLGLFRLQQPSTIWPDGVGKVNGLDATILLAELTTTDTYNVAGGVAYTTAIATLLGLAGLGGRYNIPADSRLTPADGKSFSSGTSYLHMVNALLDAIGYYTLYAETDGRVASRPYMDRLQVEPNHHFTVGQDAELFGDIDETVSDDNIYNFVLVTKTDNEVVNLQATAENANPSHPFSTVTLGALSGLPKVFKTKKVDFNEAADQAAVDAKAEETLQRSSMTRYITIQALPDPHHQIHEVVDLVFSGEKDRLSGRYYADFHGFGLVGSAGHTLMKLRRIESYE